MVSTEREPIMGVWGLCPQRGPGAEPLVGGQEGEAPLKLKTFRVFGVWKKLYFDNKFTIFATFVTRKTELKLKSCV